MFVGTTGAGKSTRMIRQLIWRLNVTRRVAANAYKLILIDTKPVSYGEDDTMGHYTFLTKHVIRDWHEIDLANDPNKLIIYRPHKELITPTEFAGFFDKMLAYRFRQANGKISALPLTIVIDELGDILSDAKKRVTYIPGFARMLAEGRSALQTLWILTQFPVFIDPSIKRTVRVIYTFRLPDENDRKVMKGIMGFKIVKEPIRDVHGFWYMNDAIQATLLRPTYFNGQNTAQLAVVQ